MRGAEVILLVLEGELQRSGEPEHQRRNRHEAKAQEHALRGRVFGSRVVLRMLKEIQVKTAATNSSATTGMADATGAPITAVRPGSSSQHVRVPKTRR
jgi:hypothetical protein